MTIILNARCSSNNMSLLPMVVWTRQLCSLTLSSIDLYIVDLLHRCSIELSITWLCYSDNDTYLMEVLGNLFQYFWLVFTDTKFTRISFHLLQGSRLDASFPANNTLQACNWQENWSPLMRWQPNKACRSIKVSSVPCTLLQEYFWGTLYSVRVHTHPLHHHFFSHWAAMWRCSVVVSHQSLKILY